MRVAVIAGIVGLQVTTVGATLLHSHLTMQDALLRHARDRMQTLAAEVMAEAYDVLRPAEHASELTRLLAEEVSPHLADTAWLERFLFEQLRQNIWLSGLYYGDADGGFVYVTRAPEGLGTPFTSKLIRITGSGREVELIGRDQRFGEVVRRIDGEDRFDPRDRPWYRGATDEPGPAWTKPYMFYTARVLGISVANPVRDPGGRVAGAVGADIELRTLSNFLGTLRIGRRGAVFVLNERAEVIASPATLRLAAAGGSEPAARFAPVAEFHDPVVRAAYGSLTWTEPRLRLRTTRFTSFDHEGDRYLAVFAPYERGPWAWTVVIHAPESDFTDELQRATMTNVAIAVALAAAACVVGVLFARAVAQPLERLRTAVVSVGADELPETVLPPTWVREVDETGRAFDHMVSAMRDRDRENAALNARLRNLAQVVEQSPVAIFIAEIGDRIVYENPRFRALVGRDSARSLLELIAGAEDRAMVEAALRRVEEEQLWRGEVTIASPAERGLRVALTLAPFAAMTGQPRQFVGIVEDVTASRKAELRLREALQEADHANKAKSTFLANMSHELRTPLNAIIGFAEVMQRRLFGELGDARYIGYAQSIHDSAQHLLSLVEDLLTVSRLEAEAYRLNEEVFDIPGMIDEVLTMAESAHAAGHAGISRDLADSLPRLQADRRALKQIVLNLLDNALKFTPLDGSVNLAAEWARDGSLAITVRDDGPGMGPERIAAALEPFGTRLDGESRAHQGTGLGLSIVNRLTKLHGGRLSIDSAPGQGTTVTVRLPGNRLIVDA